MRVHPSVLRLRPAALLTLALLAGASLAHADAAYPLKVGPTQRFLVDQTNAPFLVHGDTAWSLVVALTDAQVDQYLDNRQQKGFNTIIVNLIEHRYAGAENPYGPPKNRAGVGPFTTPGDFSTPNEAYFAHADRVIQKAADRGILVLLVPCYLGIPAGDEGWYNEVLASSEATMSGYGRYVGNRYKNFANVLWVIGGDRNPDQARSRVDALVSGIRETDPNHLFTAHCHPEDSPSTVYAGAAWLTVNNVYTYAPTYQRTLQEYNRTPVRPQFLIEARYENGASQPTQDLVRAQAYWTNLSGSMGQLLGVEAVWQFDTGWRAALDGEASREMVFLKALFVSRAWTSLVPDQNHLTLTAGVGADSTYAAAARAADGSTLIAYAPSGSSTTLTVNLSRISGTTAHAWWFNPRTGGATDAGTFPTSGSTDFIKPSTEDWVLVIDDAARGYGPPGGDAPPTVALTSPTSGAKFLPGQTILLHADASDALGSVTQVAFYDGSTVLGIDTTPPYDLSWSNAELGSHTLSAMATDNAGLVNSSAPVTVEVLSAFSAKINFQTARTITPSGYLADWGLALADRGNGFTYGWAKPNKRGRERRSRLSADKRYDTLVLAQAAGVGLRWEIVVPNGSYRVHLVAGDPVLASANYQFTVEGVTAVAGVATRESRWSEGTVSVTVTDGRLTIAAGVGARRNRICFVEIDSQ